METQYNYYFYDYGILRRYGLAVAAIRLIENHDWNDFCKLKDFCKKVFGDFAFFPDSIFEYHFSENGEWLEKESKTIPFNEENFMKITFTEYEGG
jgi:hypothetical protein